MGFTGFSSIYYELDAYINMDSCLEHNKMKAHQLTGNLQKWKKWDNQSELGFIFRLLIVNILNNQTNAKGPN